MTTVSVTPLGDRNPNTGTRHFAEGDEGRHSSIRLENEFTDFVTVPPRKRGGTVHVKGTLPLRATISSPSNRGFDALVDEMVGADTSVPQPMVPCDTSVPGTSYSRPTEAITASTIRPSQRNRATQPWGPPTRYNTPKPVLVP